ncbi:exosome complex exonuclease RRP44 homolog A [Tanacetum coccineum]
MSGDKNENKVVFATSLPSYQCPVLNNTNYTLWALRMRKILMANGVWDLIEGTSTSKETDIKKDSSASAYLFQGLPEDLQMQVAGCETAKEIWDSLKSRFIRTEDVQQAHSQQLKSLSYCGSLEPMAMPAGNAGIAHALFVSKDRRFPKIRIQTRQLRSLLDKRFIVAVDTWDCQSRYPSGHYVRTIGDIGDRETETKVVLIENDIDAKPFTSQVLAFLPALPWCDWDIDVAYSDKSKVFVEFRMSLLLLIKTLLRSRIVSTLWKEHHGYESLPKRTLLPTFIQRDVIKHAALCLTRLLDPITMDLRNMNMLAKDLSQGTVRYGLLCLMRFTMATYTCFNVWSVRRRLLDEGTCATKVQVHTLRHRNAYDRIREGRDLAIPVVGGWLHKCSYPWPTSVSFKTSLDQSRREPSIAIQIIEEGLSLRTPRDVLVGNHRMFYESREYHRLWRGSFFKRRSGTQLLHSFDISIELA